MNTYGVKGHTKREKIHEFLIGPFRDSLPTPCLAAHTNLHTHAHTHTHTHKHTEEYSLTAGPNYEVWGEAINKRDVYGGFRNTKACVCVCVSVCVCVCTHSTCTHVWTRAWRPVVTVSVRHASLLAGAGTVPGGTTCKLETTL